MLAVLEMRLGARAGAERAPSELLGDGLYDDAQRVDPEIPWIRQTNMDQITSGQLFVAHSVARLRLQTSQRYPTTP